MRETTARMRPLQWLACLPLALLPALAAAVIEGPRLKSDLVQNVTAALADAGQGWARVSLSGRDLEIRGTAPDHAAIAAAHRIASGIPGIRRVDMRAGTGAP